MAITPEERDVTRPQTIADTLAAVEASIDAQLRFLPRSWDEIRIVHPMQGEAVMKLLFERYRAKGWELRCVQEPNRGADFLHIRAREFNLTD